MEADTHSSFYSHHPQRFYCQKQVHFSVGAQDITASSSVPWSCFDVRAKEVIHCFQACRF